MKKSTPTQPLSDGLNRRNALVLSVALLSWTATSPLLAHDADDADDDHGPRWANVIPPNAHPYGLSYGEWQARWWQWSISIPWSTHPYQSAANAALNQSGPVWFLVGYGDGIPRAVTIPRGKAVFFPVVNVECSNIEPAPFFGADEAGMRAAARLFDRTNMECFIDGLPVRYLERFEGESPLFSFSAPDDNILIGAGPVSGQAVSAGTYVMVPPLSVGQHVIHFKGTQSDPILGPFDYNATYQITVPGGHR